MKTEFKQMNKVIRDYIRTNIDEIRALNDEVSQQIYAKVLADNGWTLDEYQTAHANDPDNIRLAEESNRTMEALIKTLREKGVTEDELIEIFGDYDLLITNH